MRNVSTAILLSLLVFASGCGSMRSRGSPPELDARAYVWTANRCPSLPAGSNEAAFLAVLGELVLGTLIQTGVNMAANALQAAADADKNGTVVSGAYSRYSHVVRVDPNASPAANVAEPARCLIIAYAKGDNPSAWCNDPNVPVGFSPACTQNRHILETLQASNVPFEGMEEFTADRAELPFFYAELQLEPSNDGKAARPRVVNLYYPKAFDARRSGTTRDLALVVRMQAPGDKEPNVVALTLRGLTPGGNNDKSAQELGLWTSIPAYATTVEKIPVGTRVGPLNTTVEIRETGDINAFLQAFAKAFSEGKQAYADALKNELLPSMQAKAAVAAAKGEAAVAEKQGAAEKAWVDLLTACNKPVDPTQKEAYSTHAIKDADVGRLMINVQATRLAANAAALEAGASAPYSTTTVTACS